MGVRMCLTPFMGVRSDMADWSSEGFVRPGSRDLLSAELTVARERFSGRHVSCPAFLCAQSHMGTSVSSLGVL